MPPASQDLLPRLVDDLCARVNLPESTYRLQLHAGFTFRDALGIVDYLRDLGITHAYSSPILKARPGSTHGYDITDHRALNPELGGDEAFEAFSSALRGRGLGLVVDTVPNHMGVGTNDNLWWNDVLENGPASAYADFFDIAWGASPRPELRDKVLLPVLGDPYGKVLHSGQLRLSFDDGAFAVHYYEHRFPVAPRSYEIILAHRLDELEKAPGQGSDALMEYQSILTAVRHLPDRLETDPEKVAERRREKEVIKRRLATLARESPAVRDFLEKNVDEFNGKPGDPHSFALLHALLDRQCYRLAWWRVASDEINYRRFFDVNDLAALSAEREDVFEATHEVTLRLLHEGKVSGLRVDHPDGLYDPRQYFLRLQEHYALDGARQLLESDPAFAGAGRAGLEEAVRAWLRAGSGPGATGRRWPLYVVAEKILGAGEPLPEDWAVYGTSGYDFLNVANSLFVDGANARAFTRIYQDWVGEAEPDSTPFAEVVYRKKFLILQVSLSSELHMLAHQLDRLAQKSPWSRDFTLTSLRHALREVIACFPVYRSYIAGEGVGEADRRYVLRGVRLARARNPAISGAIFDFVRDMLLLRYPEGASEEDRAEQLRFAGKFQQVTAPVMAKGLEDTAFYVYDRLVSLNEVGGDPDLFGRPPEAVHRYLAERQGKWPYSLSPLSTHDTKRSEDVRARINVLSELPDEWREALARWSRLNERHRVRLEEEELTAPDANEEYLIYQTLLGAWPLEPYTPGEYADFVKRIQAYLLKALHEAKVHTSWINPDALYDNAVQQFAGRILNEEGGREFLEDFRPFQRKVSHYGLFNSLAQALLKLTAPGVPDTYQGTELWDFSLVDPDNRRPVDYERRRGMLAELRGRVESGGDLRALARELTERKEDGRVKLYVTWRALTCRRDNPGLFSAGEYRPVELTGAKGGHVFAFLRSAGERSALVAVPRLVTKLVPEGRVPVGEVWQDTRLVLPGAAGDRWRNVFTAEVLTAGERQQGGLPLAEVLRDFPVALLLAERPG